jgi:hypothetical protein
MKTFIIKDAGVVKWQTCLPAGRRGGLNTYLMIKIF